MKLLHPWFLALCNGAAVSAWYDSFTGDYLPYPLPVDAFNVSAARQNANFSTSISFAAGTPQQSWNLTVSLAEILAQGENATAVPDARVLLTFYDVHPPANWTGKQNSGLIKPVRYDNGVVQHQLARRMTYWPFSTSATIGYQSEGDCTGVVEPECLGRLRTSNATSAIYPDSPACAQVSSRWGSPGVVQFIHNLNDSGEYRLGGFISGVYSAGNRTLIERELNRVHFAILAGNETYPLCLRFRNNEVNSSNPGTGPAPDNSASSIQTALWIVMASTVLCLFL
ncbi:hypothetical protein KC363_g8308 [Hortaea werneckii]|uniref:Uncharacterized protein n=1 Tax=Hortaea werneckii TaxID=91943 RepID=A0A3M7FLV7_HORWE|nr:hypothetical protein KC363_g8308 [Hortaea werneckii]RMY89890.1 hypothetical protein D0861_03954 [Hortaea werneckii]